jgi:hypothetical protein
VYRKLIRRFRENLITSKPNKIQPTANSIVCTVS